MIQRLSSFVSISNERASYPVELTGRLGRDALNQTQAMGDLRLLKQTTIAFLCSIKCPGDLILMAYDLARALRDAGKGVIGGFQSPMEEECFDLLSRGRQPIIRAAARSIEGMTLPITWRAAIAEQRLLLLSFCGSRVKRPTTQTAQFRNECIGALADRVLIAHASEGGKLERLAQDLLAKQRCILTFPSPFNSRLIEHGARPLKPLEIVSLLGR